MSSSKNIFQEPAIYYEKCLKTVEIKQSYNIKRNQSNQKENVTLFGSNHRTASPQKPMLVEYSWN